jgi:hypothetical protein
VKSFSGVILRLSLGVGTILAQIQPTTRVLLPEPVSARPVLAAVPSPAEPVLRYVAGSTVKVEQLLGEEDKQLHRPTLSQTVTRYGIEGTDLGNSFEHAGRVYFLFGDTVGRLRRALDTIATTDATDPDRRALGFPQIRQRLFDHSATRHQHGSLRGARSWH